MGSIELTRLIADRERNIAAMIDWSWSKSEISARRRKLIEKSLQT
jgi:hypothetical protein